MHVEANNRLEQNTPRLVIIHYGMDDDTCQLNISV